MPEVVTKIVIDNQDNNTLWLATFNGLFNYDISHNTYRHFDCEELKDKPMSIGDLYQEPSGLLL